MRFLIAAAVLACAAAAPSGLLGHGYLGHASLGLAAGPALGYAHGGHLAYAHAPALPTISPGDLQGAAIEAHVDATDHARAAVDAVRENHDQAAELHGQAINAAEDHSWQALDAVKTAEATLDGQAAGVAPVLAKQLVGHAAPLLAAPVAYGAYAGHGALLHGAYGAHGAHAAYAPAAYAASNTIVSQSLSQSHPAPLLHAAPLFAHGGHLGYGYSHGLAHY